LDKPSRRRFLRLAGTSLAGPLILPSGLRGATAPSNRIALGFIGMGSQGSSRNLGTFLTQPETVVLAVCDVWKDRAEAAKQRIDQHFGTNDCLACQDFREIIERDDLDAIVISTPDHWHVPLSLAALRAGKDVFCEKPSLTIAEGRELVREVQARKAVFQWGIEDRSLIKYHRLAGWARSGAIGKLTSIEVVLPKKTPLPKEPPCPVPPMLDWNLWQGPAPSHAFTESRTEPMHWRMITDYSGGMITDWGAHLVDTAQVGARVDHSGPVEISGSATLPDPAEWQSDVPVDFRIQYRYANGVELLVTDGEVDIRFNGTEGWVRCSGWNGKWSASSPEILRIQEFGEAAAFWPLPPIEHRDFFDCMKSRQLPAYHAEAGHRLSTTLHLGHLAVRTGRTIRWDPEREAFAEAAEFTSHPVYQRPARDWSAA
jgi:myo-inositol 2-dehydrogenase / D-chiro-inositol 1-dehydrogenase